MNSKLRKNEKRLMKQTLTENGITLIALVVTIVVLLILASVSITAVFGDNGLLKLAKEAGEKTNEAVGKELSDIQNLSSEVNDIINPPTTISEAVKRQYVFRDTTTFYAEDGKPIITIPAGFKILADTEENNVEYKDKENPTVDDGIVIADTTGNEFVWVPVFDETPIFTEYEGRLVGQSYDFGTMESPKYTADKIQYSTNISHEPDTVKTYTLNDATHNGDDNEENLNIVLEEGQEKTEDKFKEQLQKEFDYLVASVNKYKGFYIGRYETGTLSATDKTVVPEVQKNKIPANASWYYQYVESKNIARNNIDEKVQKSVTSSIIWGSQWDAVLNWFLKDDNTKEYVAKNTGMGWRKDNYETGNPKHETGKDMIGEDGKVKNRMKNIYDMAGNVIDWTMEASSSMHYRVYRGQFYLIEDSFVAPRERQDSPPSDNDDANGSRSTLIINISAK